MNLYVWRNYDDSYYPSMAFAIASSPYEARKMILKSSKYFIPDDFKTKPEIYPLDKPFALYVSGGD